PYYTVPPPYAVAPPYPVVISGAGMPNRRRRPGYLIAAVGAALGLIAFFGMPFYTVSLSSSGELAPTPISLSVSVTASQLTSSGFDGGLALSTGLFLWVIALAALAVLGLCAILPFSQAAAHSGPHQLGGLALLLGGLAVGGLTTVLGLSKL